MYEVEDRCEENEEQVDLRVVVAVEEHRCRECFLLVLARLYRAVGGALLAEERCVEVAKCLWTWALLQHGHGARHVV